MDYPREVGAESGQLLHPEVARRHLFGALVDALNAQPGTITAIRSTAGSGKSTALRELLARTPGEYLVVVPTHRLADEYGAALPESEADVRRGVTGFHLNGEHACVRHREASSLARLGIEPAKRLCPSCRHLETYRTTSRTCPAWLESRRGTARRIRVVQSTRIGEILLSLTRQCRHGSAPPTVILDEPPPVARHARIPTDLDALIELVSECRPGARQVMEEVLTGMLAGLARTDFAGAPTLDELLTAAWCAPTAAPGAIVRAASAGEREGRVKAALARLRAVEPLLTAEAERRIAREIALGRSGKDLGEAREVLDVVLEAAFFPARPFAHVDKRSRSVVACARAKWVRGLKSLLTRGARAVILDATFDDAELRALGVASSFQDQEAPGCVRMHLVDVHVRDAPGVERIYCRWSSGPRSRHVMEFGGTEHPKWSELRGVLRHLASLVRERGGPVGLIADKPTAQAIEEEWKRIQLDASYGGEAFPVELASVARNGVELRVGWYGAQRGVNRWCGVRVHATIGDPHPNIAALEAEARLLGLGGVGPLLYRRTQAEVQQASARARPIWHDVTVVHYGATAPSLEIAPQWRIATVQTLKRGRPRKKAGGLDLSAEQINAERLALGISKCAHARRLGWSKSTYLGRTSAARALPP